MKKVLILLAFVLLIPAISATFAQDQAQDLTVSCENFSCSELNVTILYPNHSQFQYNQSMTSHDSYATLSITPDALGEYTVYFYDGGNHSSTTFIVTTTGDNINTSHSIIYIGLLGILIFISVATFFGIGFLPKRNTTDQEGRIMSISYAKYLRNVLWMFEWGLIVAITYISANVATAYLSSAMLGQILLTISFMMIGVSPVIIIVWLVWIFADAINDKAVKKLLGRGIFPQGNI